jgi:hypothetical protein
VVSRVTATFPFLPRLRYSSGELTRAGHGEEEGGWLCVSLQRREDAERGQMASRAGKERGCWALSARSGRGLGCTHWKRLGSLGSMLGTALWSQSSDAWENASGFLSRSQIDRVQLTCVKIVSRPGRVTARACRAKVAWRRSFDAVQARVLLGRKACVHEQERSARSRCPWCVRGAVRARATGWPTGGVVGCRGLGDGGGVPGRPLARLQALACCRGLGLQRARSGRHWRERERMVR